VIIIRAVVVLYDALMWYLCLGYIKLGLKVVQEVRFEVIIKLNVVVDDCNVYLAGFGNAVSYFLYFIQDMKFYGLFLRMVSKLIIRAIVSCMVYLLCQGFVILNAVTTFWVFDMRVTLQFF
jgi:hypothetical protein